MRGSAFEFISDYDTMFEFVELGVLFFFDVPSERGVTANIPVLGTGDSGFESRRSDTIFLRDLFVVLVT